LSAGEKANDWNFLFPCHRNLPLGGGCPHEEAKSEHAFFRHPPETRRSRLRVIPIVEGDQLHFTAENPAFVVDGM
jgi:hypothetical protein